MPPLHIFNRGADLGMRKSRGCRPPSALKMCNPGGTCTSSARTGALP